MNPGILCVFDFDETIIKDNSDHYIKKLLPDNGTLPQDIGSLYSSESWTEYMRQIFGYLHKCGITQQQILNCLEEISLIDGFRDLFSYISDNCGHIIIISDSNSIFIEHILKHHRLDCYVSEVFTNPANFDSNGQLLINEFHHQDWCSLSTKNLCKGYILEDFLKKAEENNIKYKQVAYVGDGGNDFCPSLKLSFHDVVFPRNGFTLEKHLSVSKKDIKASVVPWTSGHDIIRELEKRINLSQRNTTKPEPILT